MIAMLVSVLVGHYQRVYDRKHFLPDQDRQAINALENLNISNDDNHETTNADI